MWCQRQYNLSIAVSPFTEMALLHFSGTNSNAGGAGCPVHANTQFHHLFLCIVTLRKINCTSHKGGRLHQQPLKTNKDF